MSSLSAVEQAGLEPGDYRTKAAAIRRGYAVSAPSDADSGIPD
jgi:hypothetical protein